jgi:hypothetical protein
MECGDSLWRDEDWTSIEPVGLVSDSDLETSSLSAGNGPNPAQQIKISVYMLGYLCS